EVLRSVALGGCQGSVTVVKQLVPPDNENGDVAGAAHAGGWVFDAVASAGAEVDEPSTAVSAVGTGAVNFHVGFPAGADPDDRVPLTVTEVLAPGSVYDLYPVAGPDFGLANAR